MKSSTVTNLLLLVIAVALAAIAGPRYIEPDRVEAQSSGSRSFYVEPGVQMLKRPDGTGQVYGKVFVDVRNGNIWGFPTGSLDPYPSHPVNTRPAVSRPFLLGRFAVEDTDR